MHFVNIEHPCCRLCLSKVVIVNKTKLQKQFQLFLYVHHKNESRIRRSPEAACYTCMRATVELSTTHTRAST